MSVYFLRDGGLVKIGYSNDVRSRIGAIVWSLRGKGEFLGCMPGGRDLEKHFHKKFSADREFGEWFRVSEALLSLIAVSTSPDFPDVEQRAGRDRLQTQEDRFAEEGALFIRNFFRGLDADLEAFEKLSAVSSIPALRLKGIYDGEVCPITAGEYVVLRTMEDAANSPLSEQEVPGTLRSPTPSDKEQTE